MGENSVWRGFYAIMIHFLVLRVALSSSRREGDLTHLKVFQGLPMEIPPNRNIDHIIEIEAKENLSISNRTDIHITIKQRLKG